MGNIVSQIVHLSVFILIIIVAKKDVALLVNMPIISIVFIDY